MNKIKIDLKQVKNSDVSEMRHYTMGAYGEPSDYYKYQFNELKTGIENGTHYKLLHYLSNEVFNNTIILDVGTRAGFSALALALSRKNTIITYDIIDSSPYITHFKNHLGYNNIICKQLDINKETEDIINSASMILLDIDPHDGLQETTFFNTLERIKYSGLVILDDIHWEEMKPFWNNIKQLKIDITDYGHGSGTGLVDFSNGEKFEILL